jgi:hypothetical protein
VPYDSDLTDRNRRRKRLTGDDRVLVTDGEAWYWNWTAVSSCWSAMMMG